MKKLVLDKWVIVLDILNRLGMLNYRQISIESKTFEAHIYIMCKLLKKKGYVTLNKKSKCVFVSLTDKGKALAELCSALLIEMKK